MRLGQARSRSLKLRCQFRDPVALPRPRLIAAWACPAALPPTPVPRRLSPDDSRGLAPALAATFDPRPRRFRPLDEGRVGLPRVSAPPLTPDPRPRLIAAWACPALGRYPDPDPRPRLIAAWACPAGATPDPVPRRLSPDDSRVACPAATPDPCPLTPRPRLIAAGLPRLALPLTPDPRPLSPDSCPLLCRRAERESRSPASAGVSRWRGRSVSAKETLRVGCPARLRECPASSILLPFRGAVAFWGSEILEAFFVGGAGSAGLWRVCLRGLRFRSGRLGASVADGEDR